MSTQCLRFKLLRFFYRGGRATNAQLAKKFGAHPGHVRGAISVLRAQFFPIGKTVSARDKIARYHLIADDTLPRLGRPPHNLAVY